MKNKNLSRDTCFSQEKKTKSGLISASKLILNNNPSI